MKIVMLSLVVFFNAQIFAQQVIVLPANSAQTQSLNSAATQAQQSLSQGAQMNTIMGAMLLMSCMSSPKPNMLVCMMGAMALAQGMQQKQAADQAAASIAASNAQPAATLSGPYPLTGVPAVAPVATSPLVPASAQSAVSGGLHALSTAGYQVTSGGVTLPNGNYMPASVLSTPEGMAAAGFSPSAIQSAQSLSTKVTQQATEKLRQPASESNHQNYAD